MNVALFIPCYVDLYYPRVGLAVAHVLEQLGHRVDCPESFTCCGQPPFNSGAFDEARRVARRVITLAEDADAVVMPSGSCTAMIKVFYGELFRDGKEAQRAAALSGKIFEFSQFLVDELGVTDVGAAFEGRATFHDGCHGLRELGINAAPRRLLERVAGLELVEMDEAQTCCGFGGTFSVKFPQVSAAMAEVKAQSVERTEARYLISNDPSCLMHLEGFFRKQGRGEVRCLHTAQVLAGPAFCAPG